MGPLVALLFPSHAEASANDASSLGWTGPGKQEKQLSLTESPGSMRTQILHWWQLGKWWDHNLFMFLWKQDLLKVLKENDVILTCINNTGIAYINNSHILNTCSVPGALWSACTPYPFPAVNSLCSLHWPLKISHNDLLIIPWRPQACFHLMEFALALCSSRILFLHICAWFTLSL